MLRRWVAILVFAPMAYLPGPRFVFPVRAGGFASAFAAQDRKEEKPDQEEDKNKGQR